MALITFLAQDTSMFENACNLLKLHHSDIHIENGTLETTVAIASKLAAQGTEIIITRGAAAAAIKKAGIEVTIVEIFITAFDGINTIQKAKLPIQRKQSSSILILPHTQECKPKEGE